MDIHLVKNKIIQQLSLINDAALLEVVRKMLEYGLENQVERISIEQYNRELDAAEAEVEAGEWVSQEELKLESEKCAMQGR